MAYKIVVTVDAKNDLEQFINYLIFDRKNTQAARNVLNDFDATIESLSKITAAKIPSYQLFESQVFYAISHCR